VTVRLDWLAGVVKYKTIVRKAVVVVEIVVLVVLVYTSLLSNASIYTIATRWMAEDDCRHCVHTASLFLHNVLMRPLEDERRSESLRGASGIVKVQHHHHPPSPHRTTISPADSAHQAPEPFHSRAPRLLHPVQKHSPFSSPSAVMAGGWYVGANITTTSLADGRLFCSDNVQADAIFLKANTTHSELEQDSQLSAVESEC
jgi:hypothetical protein